MARGATIEVGAERYFVLSTPSLRQSLPERLTEAEREVAALILEGMSNRDAAARRGTSVRTIANQVGAIFRKLGVAGRVELGQRLLSPDEGERRSPDAD